MFDQDRYKFTMLKAVSGQLKSSSPSVFTFINRGGEDLRRVIPALDDRFSRLKSLPVPSLPVVTGEFHENSLDQDASGVSFFCSEEDGKIAVRVSGPWCKATFYEGPVLQAVQEGYLADSVGLPLLSSSGREGMRRLREKTEFYNRSLPGNCRIIEMGMRRAAGHDWHMAVVSYLAENLKSLAGTSSVVAAEKFGLKAMGTMAHEYLQIGQRYVPATDANRFMLGLWVNKHAGTPMIALSDCLTTNQFFKEFTGDLARSFDGVRHDSGDPFVFGMRLAKHYRDQGINPSDKTICFSDGLKPELAVSLAKEFSPVFREVYLGIGTDFTNDLPVPALKIVMKMTEFDGWPVVKIPDEAGKESGISSQIADVRKELGIP